MQLMLEGQQNQLEMQLSKFCTISTFYFIYLKRDVSETVAIEKSHKSVGRLKCLSF
jgi:hypothetical protein